MDPQVFLRLSISCLGLRVPKTAKSISKAGANPLTSPCSCEIRLRGFPVQTTSVPVVISPELAVPDPQNVCSSFYLEDSDLKALSTPGCFYTSHASLEIAVYAGRKGSHCGVGINRQQHMGTFRLEVGPEWRTGKPATLVNGWIGIGKSKHEDGKPRVELHLRVKLDPDPRYVFQFEDEMQLSPQIVQVQGNIKQPLFSCEFNRDRVSQVDPLNNYRLVSSDGSEPESNRRERKGWKVKIHDLSGSAVAAAFITTPFVPSTGCDWVARSNPGSWLIVRPNPFQSDTWQPWGKLEAWRERGLRDSVCCRFHLLSDFPEGGELLMSEIFLSAEKGGEFFIDTDRHVQAASTPVPSPQSSGDFTALSPVAGGFVMSCRVQGEGKRGKPLVQLAMRHVTCVEDAAIFMALAAAVDLSIEACKPFRRRFRRKNRHSW